MPHRTHHKKVLRWGQHSSTPVLIAAQKGHVAVIKLLYKLGVDMAPTTAKWSAINLAKMRDHAEAFVFKDRILSKMTKECEFCGCSTKRLSKCGRCKKVRYCSRDCQVKDHKKHKGECRQSSHNDKQHFNKDWKFNDFTLFSICKL
jgi:predicted PP-loop superfamily ATPase